MKVTRRQPRYGYVQVLNAIARDYRLSWRARGLLVELLSYPPGYEITIDELVERGREHGKATEGRDAMRKAARELKALGYIVATKYQDESGRWHTSLEVTDDPMYDLLDRVSAGRTDDWKPVRRSDLGERAFPQVAPTTGKPTVGFSGVNKKTEKKTETSSSSSLTDARQSQPSHDQEEEEAFEDEDRAKARREAREAGGSRMDAARGSRMDAARGSRMDAARGSRMDAADVFKEGVEKEERTPPPPPPPPHVTPDAPPPSRAEEEGEESSPKTTPTEAVEWVLSLPWRRQPGARQRDHLAALAAAAMAAGWTPEALRRQLTTELDGVRSLYAVWQSRLQELPAPPIAPVIPLPRSAAPECPQHPGAARRGTECAACWSERFA